MATLAALAQVTQELEAQLEAANTEHNKAVNDEQLLRNRLSDTMTVEQGEGAKGFTEIFFTDQVALRQEMGKLWQRAQA